MRSSIKNRFCDKKGETCTTRFDLLLDKHARNKPTFAMRALFLPGRKKKTVKKGEERKRSSNSRRDYVCTVTAKIPRWRRRYGCDTRIFHVCLDRRASETRRDTTAGRECEERRDSHRAARARTRAAEHLFEMIPRCLIAQADIIPRAGKRDDFKQRKPPGEA